MANRRFSVALAVMGIVALAASGASAASCAGGPATNLYRDGHYLTAAVLVTGPGNITVVGNIAANGCDIGIYIGPGGHGSIKAMVSGAEYFGIVVDGSDIDVTDSSITQIHHQPDLSGAQHGVGIYYLNGAGGTISGTIVSGYQKSGIVISDSGTQVDILGNTVVGLGPTDIIAQNGIEVLHEAAATIEDNMVTGNFYRRSGGSNCPNLVDSNSSPDTCIAAATGILFFQAGYHGDQARLNSRNTLRHNQRNVAVYP
jgi:type 1 fimbria pilin